MKTMRCLTMDELQEFFKWVEEQKKHYGYLFYPAKYIHPSIDTRDLCCFSIRIRPWFQGEVTYDFRDDYSEYSSQPDFPFWEYLKLEMTRGEQPND